VELAIVIAVVVVALVFDYTNGFHDAANAIATSVSTKALTPRAALAMAAVMNFVGAFLGQEVANTVSSVITLPQSTHGLTVVMAGLVGAIAWNLLTWYYGLPSSSSHALIGGLMGAGIAFGITDGREYLVGRPGTEFVDGQCLLDGQAVDTAQCGTVRWEIILDKIVIPMVASPLFGFAAAALVMITIMWLFRKANPNRVNRGFRLAQTVSAAAMALGHGLQDAQKTMGVIFLRRRGDLAGHLRRRLAHHAHPGQADHPPRPAARLRGGVGGCRRALHDRVRVLRADLDDPHDHLRRHGRRRHQAPLRGPLGGGPQHRGRLGADLPDGRPGRRHHVLAAAPLPAALTRAQPKRPEM
jgi:hypothetical protein